MVKLSMLYFMFYFTFGGSLFFFANLFEHIGIDGKTTGLIFSSGSLIAMLFQPLLGVLADKTKKTKELLVFLMLVTGLVVSVFYMFLTTQIAFIVFVVYSITIFGTMPLVDSLAVSTTYSFGKLRLWGSIGFAVGCFISGKTISSFGEKSFLIVTLISAVVTVITLLNLDKIEVKESEKANFNDIKLLLKNKDYMYFLFFTLIILGTINVHGVFFARYFTTIGGGTTFFGIVVLLLTMSEVPFMNLAARGSEKYGTKNLLIFSGLIFIGRWFLYYILPYPNIVAGTFLLQGASVGIFFAVASAYVKTIVPKKTISTAITTFMAAGTLGGTIQQYLAGMILDKYTVQSIYFMTFILCLVAVIIFTKGKLFVKLNKN